MSKVLDYINNNWKKTVRFNQKDEDSLIGLPFPYTVPCAKGMFNEIYYWDTFFTNKGLIACEMVDLAKNNCKNMLYLVDKFGYMPNGNRTWYIGGSQPPYLALMVYDVYLKDGDLEFLLNAYKTLNKEYDFWMTKRVSANGLNHYSTDRTDEQCVEMFKGLSQRINPIGKEDPARAGRHYYAECESGWDFSARFSGKCCDYNPIDLNSNLYRYELIFAEIERLLKISDGKEWQFKADSRKEKMLEFMWDEDACVFADYNYVTGERSKLKSCAGFWPFFNGVADDCHKSGLTILLDALETEYGLLTAEKTKEDFQWGYPNCWAPCTFACVVALQRYGLIEDGKRIALKYIELIDRNFERTGGLWEKYNAINGTIEVFNEYDMPEMMGWTAGTYAYLKKEIGLKGR
ncbi:MAG: alpha,alpha-trehalase [Clostridiales bacterium]|nr:alpha,alpha-trehalase [Clostridiales bacterium]